MKSIYSYIIILLFLFTITFSQQNVTIIKKEFKKEKTGLKEAWKAVKKGNSAYSKGGELYKKALYYYLKAEKYNDINPELNYKIGVCYYSKTNYENAYKYLKKSYEFKEGVSNDIFFLLGRCLHMQYKFKEAAELYKKHVSLLNAKQLKKATINYNKYIEECENALSLKESEENIYIENLGKEINTEYPDYFPVLSQDESKMYFTSRRPAEKKEDINEYDYMFYEDIYVLYNINDEWKELNILEKPVNSEDNDVAVGTSYNDSYLYIYRGSSHGGDFFETTKNKGKWKSPKPFSAPINTKYKESSLCESSDGKIIYYVSTKKDKEAIGGKDIYLILKENEKKWNKPINIGNIINTIYDEEGVFITKDASTMYFSSQGHNSIGGFDVFKSVADAKGNWSKPENLGFPINTPGDDLFFTITEEGRYAYYSSNGHDDNYGEQDIYRIIFMGPDKEMISIREIDPIASLIKPLKTKLVIDYDDSTTNVTILKGYIKDADSLNAIYGKIEIVDNELNEAIFTSYSDSISGSYFITLPAGKSYGISVSAEGYLFQSEYLDIPISAKYEEIEKDIFLKAIKIGSKLVLKNIFFETASATLQEESYVELGFVLKALRENPTMRVEIAGHTDNVGGYNSNMKLSEERAKSVARFLQGSGIDPGRLEYKGYGYTEPVASNDTKEGRQKNRRVEFMIIGEKEK